MTCRVWQGEHSPEHPRACRSEQDCACVTPTLPARGIAWGAVLGAALWVLIIALVYLGWHV